MTEIPIRNIIEGRTNKDKEADFSKIYEETDETGELV